MDGTADIGVLSQRVLMNCHHHFFAAASLVDVHADLTSREDDLEVSYEFQMTHHRYRSKIEVGSLQ